MEKSYQEQLEEINQKYFAEAANYGDAKLKIEDLIQKRNAAKARIVELAAKATELQELMKKTEEPKPSE